MWTYIKFGLPALLLIIAAAAVFSKKTYRVERVIAAPPEAIWAVLMDTVDYGEWNPVFAKVEGAYADGQVVNTFKDPNGKLYEVTNKVLAVVENKQLRQKGGMAGVLTFDHQWLLQPVEGGTKVTQFEVDRGFYVWFWDDSWVVPSYTKTAEALAARVSTIKRAN